ncbi:MAG: response regulator [Caldilineaceae bacterium]|nr:response regulator [Caldilineaceae bacterium]
MTHEVTSPARSEPRWAESAASQAAERKTQYYSLLYREMAERKRVEAHLRQSNALLVALGEAQLRFVSGSALGAVLHDLLASLLTITQSAAGLIGEQIESPAAPPTCQIHALAGTYPDGAGHAWVTLVDRVLATGKPAGDPPFAGAGREIFPQLLGLPISIGETVVGVLVLADCADGFLPDILSLLQPALSTCAQLILAHRNEQRRKAAEQALAEERASLARRVAESTVELRLANAELTHAAHAKDEFLATINHELRTPLNSILLFAEILHKQLTGSLNERQVRAVSGIEESGHHLLTLINDILDVAKMDAGKLSVELAPCQVEMVCQASMRLVAAMANKKELQISLTIDPRVGVIQADERRLKQMLVNLLSNAVKFTPAGGAIGLEVTGAAGGTDDGTDDGADGTVYFVVWDTGIGIAAGDLRHLFQPFVQLDSGHTRQYGGTGLGLVLVHRMARMHGGRITVESEVGRGSRFTLALPWRRQEPAGEELRAPIHPALEEELPLEPAAATCDTAPGGSPGATGGDRRPLVLLAEDNDANIAALSQYLETLHYRLLIAKTGQDAIDQARLHRPNLILMDVQMPEMDGLEATRRIRIEPGLAHVPIIAMTAQVMPGDQERCLAAGVDDFVGKPIQLARLAEVLDLRLRAAG